MRQRHPSCALSFWFEKNRQPIDADDRAAVAPRELDPRALDEYLLYQYVPHPECILRGYAKLPPAHRAVFENGRLTVERYWAARS